MTLTPGVNIITRKLTPFFHLLLKLYPLVYFVFAFHELQNSFPWCLSFAFYSVLQNTHLIVKDDNLKPVNTLNL